MGDTSASAARGDALLFVLLLQGRVPVLCGETTHDVARGVGDLRDAFRPRRRAPLLPGLLGHAAQPEEQPERREHGLVRVRVRVRVRVTVRVTVRVRFRVSTSVASTACSEI